jgi:hypothetical protein
MRKARFANLMALALLLPSAQALPEGAGSLYKWEDAQGQVHYSDQRPADPAVLVETHPLPKQVPAEQGPDGDYYSVENQAKRLEEERRQREAARLEKERQRQEDERRAAELEALRAPAPPQVAAPQGYGYPVYVLPFRPIRPPHPPHPPHPPYPPPQRSLQPIPAPSSGGSIGIGRPSLVPR